MVKELSVDVNHAMENGTTPLFIAACYGQLAMVRCLVEELGADVNKTSQEGVTPLVAVAGHEYGDFVAFLLKYGANIQDSSHVFRRTTFCQTPPIDLQMWISM
jgi:ankyrin repeat protein